MARHNSYESLIRVVHYRHIIFLLICLFVLYIHSFIDPGRLNVHLRSDSRCNPQTILLLLVYVPGKLLGWYSTICALLPLQMQRLAQQDQKRVFTRFILCYVTKGLNTEVSNNISQGVLRSDGLMRLLFSGNAPQH
jgi:hypothetical protein